ncbi:hypothetical protein [Paraglaciecola aestuariivivens]
MAFFYELDSESPKANSKPHHSRESENPQQTSEELNKLVKSVLLVFAQPPDYTQKHGDLPSD